MGNESNQQELVFVVPASKHDVRVRIQFDVALEAGDLPIMPRPPDGLRPPDKLVWGNQEVKLEPMEYAIMQALLANADKAIGIEDALEVMGSRASESSMRAKCHKLTEKLKSINYYCEVILKAGHVVLELAEAETSALAQGMISIGGGFIRDGKKFVAMEAPDTKTPPAK